MWKNGKEIHLENNELYSDTYSVFVNTNDVYVAGYIQIDDENVASIWKNGKIQKLTDGKTPAHANSFFVENNNVFILGEELSTKYYIIKAWKNNVPTEITNGENPAYCSSIFVYEGDVYISGYNEDGSRSKHYRNYYIAKIWKNVKQQNLSNGLNNAFAKSIFVENVYVVGYEIENDKEIDKLWKNGKPQNLSNGINNSLASSIYVWNNNTYIVGKIRN